ncbi:class I SAM-dependent methyltransferase [Marinicella litoralis]|uniref:Putative methyltransferase n=1 Tax=Marinicella litoralis TaxID=644220 RepID=A0A4R6XLD6_9GAMM|nr:class I SAM-dependent methyltransferase [Marinicella litoralis]TDR20422.1 putative methyltransferase [Marinicella litoralis]
MKKLLVLALMAGLAFNATADNHSESTADMIKMAMKSEIRTTAETDRDRNRRPVETLEFFGFEHDMKVVELLPGGGWYSKILAPVLKEHGELIVALGTGRISTMIEEHEALSAIKVGAEDSNIYRKDGARFYSVENADIGVKNADMVLTFRNYHNFAEDGRKAMNDAAWDALKMGGIYGVVDHTRRHMEGDNDENRRRIDPVLAILEIQAAGFELVDYSDLHYRADDELEYEVGRKSVTGNTDRWTLKFKKVKK